MYHRFILMWMFLWVGMPVFSQVIIIPTGLIASAIVPENGFLPGKKFAYYATVERHDLKKAAFRVEVYDDRARLKLSRAGCSEMGFTHTSEFETPECIYKLGEYADTLLRQSNAFADPAAADTLLIRLQGFDARLTGTGIVRAHGICQVEVKYREVTRVYCSDLTDADPHSPISPNAFVTRKTATRVMASAAMREVIEMLITDLEKFSK